MAEKIIMIKSNRWWEHKKFDQCQCMVSCDGRKKFTMQGTMIKVYVNYTDQDPKLLANKLKLRIDEQLPGNQWPWKHVSKVKEKMMLLQTHELKHKWASEMPALEANNGQAPYFQFQYLDWSTMVKKTSTYDLPDVPLCQHHDLQFQAVA